MCFGLDENVLNKIRKKNMSQLLKSEVKIKIFSH